MSQADVLAELGPPFKKQAFLDEDRNAVELLLYRETTWDDGGWSWDRTVVSTTLTFVNQDLVAIGNLPDRYKDKNPFRPDVWIQQDVTVKHR
jgi:hypothetical protein